MISRPTLGSGGSPGFCRTVRFCINPKARWCFGGWLLIDVIFVLVSLMVSLMMASICRGVVVLAVMPVMARVLALYSKPTSTPLS